MNNLINKINLRFESGNSVPVDSVRITREEWDLLVSEHDAALEREQALAALMEEAIEEFECIGDFDSEYSRIAPDMAKRLNDLESTLTRRDLIKQAEALEHMVSKFRARMPEPDKLCIIDAEIISDYAADLRQRAQALK